jgi:hypothetical protein
MSTSDTAVRPATSLDRVRATAVLVLDRYATATMAGRPGIDHPADAGPAVLAALVAADPAAPSPSVSGPAALSPAALSPSALSPSALSRAAPGPSVSGPAASGAVERALQRWLQALRGGCPHGGMFGWGLAGCHRGLRAAAAVLPALGRDGGLVATTRRALLASCAAARWRAAEVDWSDYDLLTGPAGLLLALAGEPGVTRRDLQPVVAHLSRLSTSDDLAGFRIGRYYGEHLSGWNYGRVNTGPAHGVAGVAVAFCAVADAYGPDEQIRAALRQIAGWLLAQAYPDDRGLLTWLPGERQDGARPATPSRRHAWCYGTPGVAWSLWETGRVLADPGLQAFAEAAFGSFLAVPDANRNESYLDDLAMCHGGAGLLVLCDAFDRYAGLAAAGHERDRLAAELAGHLDVLPEWAAADASLLSGASGVLAALLSTGPADRSWLTCFGMR